MSALFVDLYTELAARLNDSTHTLWPLPRKKAFVNGSIRHYNDVGGFRYVTDESLLVVANQTEYALPAGIISPDALISVSVEGSGAGSAYTEYTRRRVIANGPTCKLVLSAPFSEAAGKKIRVVYQGAFADLSADADATDVPSEFLYAYGKFLAHDEAAGRPDQAARQWHLDEAKRAFDVANVMLPLILPRRPAQRVVPAEQ